MRLLIILMLTSRVSPELQVKHSMYVSRKSRSYSSPSGNSYYYSNYDSDYKHKPRIQSISSNDHLRSFDGGKDSIERPIYSVVPSYQYYKTPPESYNEHLSGITYTTVAPLALPVTKYYEEPTTKYDIDYEKMKSEARYNSRFLPSKIKSDLMYERLKSLMHYKPYSDHKISEIEFDVNNEYHSDDDDDIRTTSSTHNEIFPYFYHGPYEYEYDSHVDKDISKRYTPENYHNVIPVHENISDDIPPNNYKYNESRDPPTYTVTKENTPFDGDTGFFSYVLNDYYDKASEEDPLVFNGIQWGKEINYDSNFYDDDVQRRRRHKGKHNLPFYPTPNYISTHAPEAHKEFVTEQYNTKDNYSYYTTPTYINKDSTVAHHESATERGHTKKSEFENGTSSDESKARNKIGYDKHKAGYKSFKDIADSLAHKFGTENHSRDTKHKLKHNQDKGENRRGFHRVYHKDEYMEDKEFFDNKNSSSRGEDKGHSSIGSGGSEAVLKSQAIANVGDESNASRHVGDRENKHSKSNYRGHNSSNEVDSAFNRYRDMAKKAVHSNNANYHGHI